MKDPIGNHVLTEPDARNIVDGVTHALRGRHTRSVARHAELDVGEPIFSEMTMIAEVYANYRLGFKEKTADDVKKEIAALRGVLDVNFANFLAAEVMDAIDTQIDIKLGQQQTRMAM